MSDNSFGNTDDWNSGVSTPTLDTPSTLPAPAEEKKPEVKTPAPAKKPAAKKAAPRRAAARKPARGAAAKVDVRKVIEKTLTVSEFADDDRELIATILGTDNDTTEIVVAIIDGGTVEGVEEAIELSEIESDGERGIRAAMLGDSLKGVWAVYHALGLVGAEAPDAPAKAALALIDAASKFADDDSARDRLTGVMEAIS